MSAVITTMFGAPDDFAIEACIEPDCEHQVTVWGRSCVWCFGIALGNIHESYGAIGQVYGSLLELTSRVDDLWSSEFDGRDDLEIMNFLDERLYGMHGDVEVPKDRTIKQVAAEGSR